MEIGDSGNDEIKGNVDGIVTPLHGCERYRVDELVEGVAEAVLLAEVATRDSKKTKIGLSEEIRHSLVEGNVQCQPFRPEIVGHKLGDIGVVERDPPVESIAGALHLETVKTHARS